MSISKSMGETSGSEQPGLLWTLRAIWRARLRHSDDEIVEHAREMKLEEERQAQEHVSRPSATTAAGSRKR